MTWPSLSPPAVGVLLSQVRQLQPWADGKLAKAELDGQLADLLGPRTPEDDEKPAKKKKEKKPTKPEEAAATVAEPATAAASVPPEEADPYAIFPKPSENLNVHTEIFFSKSAGGGVWRPRNSRERLEAHLAATGGAFVTRFPPEPNGYLHIGHAKAMNVDFGLAKEHAGRCYLRFDDTNPEAEKQEYIDHIQEIVSWLGWQPYKVTYSSDYFKELYNLALRLIERGYAYVDHQMPEEVRAFRERKEGSPWRDRPAAESLRLFDEMRRGLVDEGAATLRMRQDVGNDNPNMWDLIAYRIKVVLPAAALVAASPQLWFTRHPHAGDAWCIYPSYDYTHCLVDSLENITHSLCTLEFESRRASYYWLLECLDLYHPHVWEYARLNITHTLNRLVTEKHVDGWDDPRLMTLAGLRRRGASPEAINVFCRAVGITRSDNMIRVELLEHFMRDDLNRNAPRSMVVLSPLKVVITNLEEGIVEELDAKLWPDAKDGDASTHYKIPFSRTLYIESTDFRLEDSKDFYGLAPGKIVMLRYAYPIRCVEVVMGDDGVSIKELHAEYDPAKSTKPKGVIHWVAEPAAGVEPLRVEVRLLEKLFLSENPNEKEDFLCDLNPSSRMIVRGAMAVPSMAGAKAGAKFQFERIGYFCVDQDSVADKLVFNRTVTLRESSSKAAAK
eukprot:SM000033S12401  [mRNA]  locus=s33:775213:780031:- [translate_table: standard]